MDINQEKLMYTSTDGIKYILNSMCRVINKTAPKGHEVYICEFKNGERKYVIFDKEGNPVYVSNSAEEIAVHMDIIKLYIKKSCWAEA